MNEPPGARMRVVNSFNNGENISVILTNKTFCYFIDNVPLPFCRAEVQKYLYLGVSPSAVEVHQHLLLESTRDMAKTISTPGLC
jgi:F0F1-type ATP synthase beta subunit